MKKIKWFFPFLLIAAIILFITIGKSGHYIEVESTKGNIDIKHKGLKEARDFSKNKDTFYVAFKNEIIAIEGSGKSYKVLWENNLDITSLEYLDNKLYYLSKGTLYSYDLQNEKEEVCLENIPYIGDYGEGILKANGKYIYITVGAATNSGVVGEDNTWKKNYPTVHDYSPENLILNGVNFGDNKTSAFKEFGKSSSEGETIEKKEIGNSSILIYNTETKAFETYGWGIRNVKGLDFSSEGKLYAAIGGMENRGDRPIVNDKDYIYEIKKGVWHGFPDYSGGDPVDSPRFMDESGNTQKFVIADHPNKKPHGPIYQHDKVSSIETMAIDKKGAISEKDTIYFYDNIEKALFSYNPLKVPKKIMDLGDKVNIKSMKFIEDKLYILENNKGILYEIKEEDFQNNKNNLSGFFRYLIVIILTIAITVIIVFIK